MTESEFKLLIDILFGIAIIIIAAKGLEQLSLTKKISDMNEKRAAYTCAVEQCAYYTNDIVKKSDELYTKMKTSKITFFYNIEVEVDLKKEKILLKWPISTKEELALVETIIPDIIILINSLEIFALFFSSKLADEKIAFPTTAESYCKLVKLYSPILIMIDDNSTVDSPIYDLFFIWEERIIKEKLDQRKKIIEVELKSSSSK